MNEKFELKPEHVEVVDGGAWIRNTCAEDFFIPDEVFEAIDSSPDLYIECSMALAPHLSKEEHMQNLEEFKIISRIRNDKLALYRDMNMKF